MFALAIGTALFEAPIEIVFDWLNAKPPCFRQVKKMGHGGVRKITAFASDAE